MTNKIRVCNIPDNYMSGTELFTCTCTGKIDHFQKQFLQNPNPRNLVMFHPIQSVLCMKRRFPTRIEITRKISI